MNDDGDDDDDACSRSKLGRFTGGGAIAVAMTTDRREYEEDPVETPEFDGFPLPMPPPPPPLPAPPLCPIILAVPAC